MLEPYLGKITSKEGKVSGTRYLLRLVSKCRANFIFALYHQRSLVVSRKLYANREGRLPLRRTSQGECTFILGELCVHLRVLTGEMNLKIWNTLEELSILAIKGNLGQSIWLTSTCVGAAAVYCWVVKLLGLCGRINFVMHEPRFFFPFSLHQK